MKPVKSIISSKRLKNLNSGYELIVIFNILFSLNIVLDILMFKYSEALKISYPSIIINIIISLILGAVIILNGMIRIMVTSLQLGIKWRLFIFFFWWVPIVNIFLIIKVCKIVRNEYEMEFEKEQLFNTRKENEICSTKYPVLMVHGVFFRDMNFFNYWGRVPRELIRNGATVFYGEQQSAASVENSAKFLAERIKDIINETGCEKVNIIAHSKGGLDSRYAISCLGMDKYVASLTTISTPHRGCIFAEYILNKAPAGLCKFITEKYNAALRKFGEKDSDFLGAVTSLTAKSCEELNKVAIDSPNVFYSSYMSKLKKSSGGKFPTNVTYLLVKKFDGENDGLVSVDSAKWGENYFFIENKYKRGISHADMIDLNREDIKGFDIREFYVDIIKGLKARGF